VPSQPDPQTRRSSHPAGSRTNPGTRTRTN